MSIKFKETFYNESEETNICDALRNETDYLSCAKDKLSAIYNTENIFLTANGSLALDILLLAYDFPKTSEVILPSFTYPSAVNSILRMGLTPVFCDIDVHTLVMDIDDAKRRMTDKTLCVIPTHYGGASCNMDILKDTFSGKVIIEDAALSIGAAYNNKPLGAIGDAGIISFHKTKNISSDEGGMLVLNDASMLEKMETIYENGTDRQKFLRGDVPFYSWQGVGLNGKMSNLNAAVLFAQIDKVEVIMNRQTEIFDAYMKSLMPHAKAHGFDLPQIPPYNTNNAHVFYIIFQNKRQRDKVKTHLKAVDIEAVIHYVPLHQSEMGKGQGCSPNDLPNTLKISECMLRLPMHAGMTVHDCDYIAQEIGNAL